MSSVTNVTQDTIRYDKRDFQTNTALKAEYVLKVNNVKDDAATKSSSIAHKKNKNPENLPAIRNTTSIRKARKLIVLTLLFISCFSMSVYIGYTATFMLFTIK